MKATAIHIVYPFPTAATAAKTNPRCVAVWPCLCRPHRCGNQREEIRFMALIAGIMPAPSEIRAGLAGPMWGSRALQAQEGAFHLCPILFPVHLRIQHLLAFTGSGPALARLSRLAPVDPAYSMKDNPWRSPRQPSSGHWNNSCMLSYKKCRALFGFPIGI